MYLITAGPFTPVAKQWTKREHTQVKPHFNKFSTNGFLSPEMERIESGTRLAFFSDLDSTRIIFVVLRNYSDSSQISVKYLTWFFLNDLTSHFLEFIHYNYESTQFYHNICKNPRLLQRTLTCLKCYFPKMKFHQKFIHKNQFYRNYLIFFFVVKHFRWHY